MYILFIYYFSTHSEEPRLSSGSHLITHSTNFFPMTLHFHFLQICIKLLYKTFYCLFCIYSQSSYRHFMATFIIISQMQSIVLSLSLSAKIVSVFQEIIHPVFICFLFLIFSCFFRICQFFRPCLFVCLFVYYPSKQFRLIHTIFFYDISKRFQIQENRHTR